MKLEELSPETLEKIRAYRWDRIIEKHEGPWTWDYLLESKTVEFFQMDGYEVLLPIDKEHHRYGHLCRIPGDMRQSPWRRMVYRHRVP